MPKSYEQVLRESNGFGRFTEMHKPYQEGHYAASNGDGMEKNPFPQNSDLWTRWNDGWKAFHAEMVKSIQEDTKLRLIQVVTGSAGRVKVYYDKDWEQYISKAEGSDEASWGYDDDKQGALDTAQAMANDVRYFNVRKEDVGTAAMGTGQIDMVDRPLFARKKPQQETFAGAKVFEVSSEVFHRARIGKNRYHRWSRYVGEDALGEEIRAYGKSNPKNSIILKDNKSGAMFYLRREATEMTPVKPKPPVEYADKLKLAIQRKMDIWRHWQNVPEDDRIDALTEYCVWLCNGDRNAAQQMTREALWG